MKFISAPSQEEDEGDWGGEEMLDEAESLYQKSLTANPKHLPTLINYAELLQSEERQNDDGTEALYSRAMETVGRWDR